MLRVRRSACGGDVIKVALTGADALELPSAYFREAGYEVMPQDVALDVFKPDFVYDITSHDAVLSSEVPSFTDERMARLAGTKYSRDGLKAIVDEFQWETLKSPKKILAVDADNTLWRGIVSEDGFDIVKPYRVFQEGLKRLREEGVVLVLISKNDPFATRDDNVPPVDLSLFASRRVNWAPKAGNLLEICRELNLFPDSVVFVDDNPHEQAQMKAHLPEVTIAPFHGFPEEDGERAERQFVRRLREYFFFTAGLTDEDRLRAADYSRQRVIPSDLKTRAEYLADLVLTVCPSRASTDDLPRLVQMAGKTNQFNATTIRRDQASFEGCLDRTYVFRAADRFGEQGLVCYLVTDETGMRITDFVMSCRAMGRTLEFYALNYVTEQLGHRLEIDFVPTPKNKPFADFLAARAAGETRTYYATAR